MEVSIEVTNTIPEAKRFTLQYKQVILCDNQVPCLDGPVITAVVYKDDPSDIIGASHINHFCLTTGYLHLFLGNAFETIGKYWNALAGHLHRFEYDDSTESDSGWHPVLHFWNCDPNWTDPNVNQDSMIHLAANP